MKKFNEQKETNIQVGTVQKPLHIYFWLAVVFSIVAIASLSIYIGKHRQSNEQLAQDNPAVQQAVTDANKLWLTNDFSGAYDRIDKAIATTAKTDKEKAQLLNIKSTAALNAKDYKLAFDAAEESESLHTTVLSARNIAESAKGLGDKETAIKYWKIQIDRMQKSDENYIPEDIDAVNQEIKQLQGTQ